MVRTRGNNKKGKYVRKTRKTNNRGRTRKTNISRKNNRRKNNRRTNNRRTNNRRTNNRRTNISRKNNRRKNTKLQNTSILGGGSGITPTRPTEAEKRRKKRAAAAKAQEDRAEREKNREAMSAANPGQDIHGPSGIAVTHEKSRDVKGVAEDLGGWDPGTGRGEMKREARDATTAATLRAAATRRSPVENTASGATFGKLRRDALDTLQKAEETAATTSHTTLRPARVSHLARYGSKVNTEYAGRHPVRGGVE